MRLYPADKTGRLAKPSLIQRDLANQVQGVGSARWVDTQKAQKTLRELPIVIEQVEKDPTTRKFETITFVHSDLPERLEIGKELIHESVWYPGNNELEIQILNDKPKDIVIAGTFNDRIWQPKNILNVGATETHAQDQAKQLKLINDSQVECRFAWGNLLEAYCILQDLTLTYKDLATVGYEARLVITRKTEIKGTEVKVDTSVELQQAIVALEEVKPIIDAPPTGIKKFIKDAYDAVVGAYYSALDFMQKAFAAWGTIQNAISSVVEAIDSVFNAMKTALAFIERARGFISELRTKLDGWNAISHSAFNRVKDLLDIQTWVGAIRNSAFKCDRHLKNSKETLLTLSESLILGAHRVREGETLYSISELYYSSPFYINDIISFNRLVSPTVAPGLMLSIPRRNV